MKMKEAIMGLSKRKKIALIFIILCIIAMFVGIVFASFNFNAKTVNSEISTNNENDIPNVNSENTVIDISEIEETKENITIKVSSKLENYNLYYYINPIEQAESETNEVDNKEENYTLYQDIIEIESNSNIYFKYESNGIYSEDPYILEINNINKQQVMTVELENEEATEEELQKEKVTTTNHTAKYYVIVNYGSNVVTVYGKDANNEYTVPVKAMVCSTGTATPRSGVYKLTTTRYRWRALFGGVYGQYAVKIVGNILFHSVPYLSTDNGTLEYWEYDKLGTSASAGCVRLTVEDALWIYNNCESGTQVEFSANSANPLGKPTAKKISSYQEIRGYDPTDPASNNPWKNANISSQNNNSNNNMNDNNSNVSSEVPPKEEEPSKPDNTQTNTDTNTENQNTTPNESNTIENTITDPNNGNTNSSKDQDKNTSNNQNSNTDTISL